VPTTSQFFGLGFPPLSNPNETEGEIARETVVLKILAVKGRCWLAATASAFAKLPTACADPQQWPTCLSSCFDMCAMEMTRSLLYCDQSAVTNAHHPDFIRPGSEAFLGTLDLRGELA
jgi:hypothetical protein